VSNWRIDGSKLHYTVSVPANTSADLKLPCSGNLKMNGKTLDMQMKDGYIEMMLAGGDYEFVCNIASNEPSVAEKYSDAKDCPFRKLQLLIFQGLTALKNRKKKKKANREG
jgi:hypothetical protein